MLAATNGQTTLNKEQDAERDIENAGARKNFICNFNTPLVFYFSAKRCTECHTEPAEVLVEATQRNKPKIISIFGRKAAISHIVDNVVIRNY